MLQLDVLPYTYQMSLLPSTDYMATDYCLSILVVVYV